MDMAAVFFTLAVITLVGIYVGQPFIQRRGRRASQEDHQFSALMAEYDRAVNTLQELDFDHSLGKIPAEDYPKQRAELLTRGADLLRRLDLLTPSPSVPRAPTGALRAGARDQGNDAESRMEAAVASRRADAALNRVPATLNDDDLELMIASRRKAHKEKSAGFCPKCGKPIMVSDRFCPSCGKAIN